MSPRRVDADIHAVLVDTAARIVSEAGPSALSTRRLAAEVGTSTMAIYTHFGSMGELVREIVHEGFSRLAQLFATAVPTQDAVADLAFLGRLYRHNALTNRHLYGVMFGGASLQGFELSQEERQYGRFTLSPAIECASRCIADGRFRTDDAALVGHQMWLGIHGTITLELGEYLIDPYDAQACFETQLVYLMTGAGDAWEAARKSAAASGQRYSSWLGA